MSGQWSTHEIEITRLRVIRRFRSCESGEHEREWRALTLLDRYAPGLAPKPLSSDLTADPPVVIMSRLQGEPLRGGIVAPEQTEAIAAALSQMFNAVPASEVTGLPLRRWHQAQMETAIRDAGLPDDAPNEIRHAVHDGLRWLDTSPLESECHVPPVFGQADGNLANYLWDGERVGLVDFEDSGRSDRAYELSDIVEHIASWVDTDFDTRLLLDHFDLTQGEQKRLIQYRRLHALLWLLVIAHEHPDRPRNPPGTATRQAERLHNLLG